VDRSRKIGRGEARSSRRVDVEFSAEYASAGGSGNGTVRNISLGGALIDSPTPVDVECGELRIRFAFFPDAVPIEVRALVVRETEGGFAVRFVGLNGRIRALLGFALARLGRENQPGARKAALLPRSND
jgi:hypothetical protein